MIYKICPKCRTMYEVGQECPKGCFAFAKKQNNKWYDKHKRKNAEVYHNKKWDKVRLSCLMKYDNICIYTYFKYNKVVPAVLVHHITEVSKDTEKALIYDLDNLIPASDKAHREIHARYKEEKLEDVQEELRAYIKAYAYGEVLRRRGY